MYFTLESLLLGFYAFWPLAVIFACHSITIKMTLKLIDTCMFFSAQQIAGQMKEMKEENVALRKEIDELRQFERKHCVNPSSGITF